MRYGKLLVLLGLLPLLGGCFGAQGVPLPADRRAGLRASLAEVDGLRLAFRDTWRARADRLGRDCVYVDLADLLDVLLSHNTHPQTIGEDV